MALNIFSSNRVEVLQSRLAQQVVVSPLTDPFAPELIVIPTFAAGRWLNLQFAKQQGIAANFDYQLSGAWIWKLLAQLLGVQAQKDPYAKDAVSWEVFHLLPDLLNDPEFELLEHYLENDASGVKQWQLSQRIADCFDRYQLYRPNMITGWDQKTDQQWQAQLWNQVVDSISEIHRVDAIKQGLARLQAGGVENLPGRISLFALSNLAPAYIELIHALAAHTEIFWYQHSPTDDYWADLVSEKTLARKRLTQPDPDHYYETRNHLLSSWGRQGQVMQDLLVDLSPVTANHQEDYQLPGRETMLHCLQSNLFELCDTRLDRVDSSVSIQVCHSPMRECQVLHDFLLEQLQQDPDLDPEDILVMTPEISRYAPYIEASFQPDDSGNRPNLPWNISDINVSDGQPLVTSYLKLLRLPESRFPVSEICGYLESETIRHRFDITPADMEQILPLLDHARVHWGLDASHRETIGLPGTGENTWQQAWDRLFSGFAMSETELWQGIAPIDQMSTENAAAIARLKHLIDRLGWWRNQLSQPASSDRWQQRLHLLIDDFFGSSVSDDESLQPLRELISELGGRKNTVLSPALVSHWMERKLSQKQLPGHLYSGGITFCGLQPLRNIPFKVICLLGMQETAFPRRPQRHGFDLMQQHWQPGDPSSGDEDRYLMLETLMSARQFLYFSYCGRSLKDDSECQPSSLLREFCDYIDDLVESKADSESGSQAITRYHPMQPYSALNFAEPHYCYDNFWYKNTQRLHAQSHALEIPQWPEAKLPDPPESSDEIDIASLVRFFQHPIRYFYNHRLGINLNSDDSLDDDEPFQLDALQRWSLIDEITRRHTLGKETVFELLKARGLLPLGQAAESNWNALQSETRTLFEHLEAYQGEVPVSRYLELSVEDFTLFGEIKNCYPKHGLMHISASRKIKSRAICGLWLEHLALCASQQFEPPEFSRLIVRDVQSTGFTSLETEKASTMLKDYLKIFRLGMQSPLSVFPDTSFAWASQPDPERAFREAKKLWLPGFFGSGECDDPYIRQVMPVPGTEILQQSGFQHLARRIYGPLIDHLVDGG